MSGGHMTAYERLYNCNNKGEITEVREFVDLLREVPEPTESHHKMKK